MYQFKKTLADLQLVIAPIGESFLKIVTPIMKFVTGVLNGFNHMNEGFRNFVVIGSAIGAIVAPALLMVFGLVANGAANIIKLFAGLKAFFNKTTTASETLGETTNYLTQEQIKAEAVAASLDQIHGKLKQTFTSEASAVNMLTESLQRAVAAQEAFAGPAFGFRGPGVKGYATGGLITGPGTGTSDSIMAKVSNGEAIIPAKSVQEHPQLVSQLINGSVPTFASGGIWGSLASMLSRSRVATRMPSATLLDMLSSGDMRYRSAFETGTGADYVGRNGLASPQGKRNRSLMEDYAFGIPFMSGAENRPTYGSVATTNPVAKLLNTIFGGIRGKQFNQVTNPMSDKLDIYGDISLIGKRGLNARSSVFGNDILRAYLQNEGYFMNRKANGIRVPGMLGSTEEELIKNGQLGNLNSPFNSSTKMSNGMTSYNPATSYLEAHTFGGFSLSEISQIIAKNPELVPLIRSALKERGLSIPVRAQGQGILSRILGYATGGIVRGPGTGTSDSILTKISNGEAVIPAASVARHPDIVNSLISGKLPGFAKGYTNAVSFLSKKTNTELMSGGTSASELSQELSNGGQKVFAPILNEIARSLGATNTAQISKMIDSNPEFKHFATQLSEGLIKEIGTSGKIDDPSLSEKTRKVANKISSQMSEQFQGAVGSVFDTITTVEDPTSYRINSKGKWRSEGRIGLFKGVGSYRSRAASYQKTAAQLSGDIAPDSVMAHLSMPVVKNSIADFANTGRELTLRAKNALDRFNRGVISVYREGFSQQREEMTIAEAEARRGRQNFNKGLEVEGQVQSPSKKSMAIGANYGKGFLIGAKQGSNPRSPRLS